MTPDETIEELRQICSLAESVWLEGDKPESKDALARYYQTVSPTLILALIQHIDQLREQLAAQVAHGSVIPAPPTFTQTIQPQRFDAPAEEPWSLGHAVAFASTSGHDTGLTVDDDEGRRHAALPEAPPESPASSDSDFSGGGGDSGGGGASGDY